VALDFAEESGQPEDLSEAFHALMFGYLARNKPRLSRIFLNEAIDIAREHHLARPLLRGLANRSSDAILYDLPLAVASGREADRLMRQGGRVDWTYIQDLNFANALYLSGDWDGCMQVIMNRIPPPSESLAVTYSQADVAGTLIHIARGETPEIPAVWSTLDDDLAHVTGVDIWPLLMRAARAVARDDLPGAVRHGIRATSALFDLAGFQEDFPVTWTWTMEWALAAGLRDEACDLVAMVANAPRSQRSPLLHGEFLRLRATLATLDPGVRCRPDDLAGDLRQAIATLGEVGAIPHRARAQATLGAWLRDNDREAEGADLLAAARETFVALGATRWLEEMGEGMPADPGVLSPP
jgi:hypothetical protein